MTNSVIRDVKGTAEENERCFFLSVSFLEGTAQPRRQINERELNHSRQRGQKYFPFYARRERGCVALFFLSS